METEQKTKVCRTCKIEKNVEEFSKDKKSLRGIKYICRICDKQYSKQYRENNPDKVKETNKQYRENNKNKIKETNKKYCENNIEKEMFSRDFTCNSLLLSLNLNKIYDPTKNGIKDINNKIIKCCTEPEFTFNENNKTRAIRCIYLSAKLDFDVDEKIIQFLKKNPNNFKLPSQKFAIEKLNKSIELNPDRTIYLINKLDLWDYLPMTEKLLPYYKGSIKK
mgnify:CR=1 FL=1